MLVQSIQSIQNMGLMEGWRHTEEKPSHGHRTGNQPDSLARGCCLNGVVECMTGFGPSPIFIMDGFCFVVDLGHDIIVYTPKDVCILCTQVENIWSGQTLQNSRFPPLYEPIEKRKRRLMIFLSGANTPSFSCFHVSFYIFLSCRYRESRHQAGDPRFPGFGLGIVDGEGPD